MNFVENPYDEEAGEPLSQVLEVDFGRDITFSEADPLVIHALEFDTDEE